MMLQLSPPLSQSRFSRCYFIVKHDIRRKTTCHLIHVTVNCEVKKLQGRGTLNHYEESAGNKFLSLKNGWDINKKSQE